MKHAFLALLASATVAHAEIVIVPPGATPSQLRALVVGGANPSDWTRPAAGANTRPHEGRAAGTLEDQGRGEIRGGIRADAAGRATLYLQDVGDAHAGALTIATRRGETTTWAMDGARADGNWLAIRLTGLLRGAWNGIRVTYAMLPGSRGKGRAQDGYGVCRG